MTTVDYEELRDILVQITTDNGFDVKIPFTIGAREGMYIVLHQCGWAIHLGRDGHWFLEDTSGG